MANEKLGVPTEPSPESLQKRSFTFVQWSLKFERTSLFYSASCFSWGGLELCFGRAKPLKAPRRDCVAQRHLLFNAIDSEK